MANNPDHLDLANQNTTLSTVLDTTFKIISRRMVAIVPTIIIQLVLVRNINSGRFQIGEKIFFLDVLVKNCSGRSCSSAHNY